MKLKFEQRERLSKAADQFNNIEYKDKSKPWSVPSDIAIPCATQNEIDLDDVKLMVKNELLALCEGANMPVTRDAQHYLRDHNILYAPGKASNAGGVAVSGLEISQNTMRLNWERDEVDQKLQKIMLDIHRRCIETQTNQDQIDYLRGANLASFKKVADAMLAHGSD